MYEKSNKPNFYYNLFIFVFNLHEASVLDPYIIEGNLKEIVIPENGKSQSIKIINDRQSEEPEDPENNETTEEVEVPDTGVTRSNTLIIISIVCMVLGSVLVIFSKHKQKAC